MVQNQKQIAVYCYLCNRADRNGECYPSVRLIAKDLNLARSTEVPNVEGLYIDEIVAALENLGFLVHTETEYSGTVAEGGIIVPAQ